MANIDDTNYQLKSAPTLRALAIDHLRNGKGKVAEGFRGAATAGSLDASTEAFLNQQSKNGAWGTYIELAALGELFNINIRVKDSNNKRKTAEYSIYESTKPKAPTITIENSNNKHWSFKGRAIGDGNCLYNAMALALRSVKAVIPNFIKSTVPAKPLQSKDAKNSEEAENSVVISQQKKQLTTLWKTRELTSKKKPSEDVTHIQEQSVLQNNARLVNYNGKMVTEAQQIDLDRQMAIRLAMRP